MPSCRILVAWLLFQLTSVAFCQDNPPADAGKGVKRALIVCGHPGDEEHARMYAGTIRDLRAALVSKLSFTEPEIRIQFGGTWPEDPAQPESKALQHGPATRESLEAEAASLRDSLRPEDTLWVIVLGHGHYDGRKAVLNLPGPDLSSVELGKLFAGIDCREQVFFMTTSVSGFFLKPLARTGRIVISATEADYETNETMYPISLAEELAKLGPEYPDEDQDGVRSLSDLYIGVARNVAQRYVDTMTLATEHSKLDDNGDGRGSEIQIDYLTVEQGGRHEAGKPIPRRSATSDGGRATQVILVPTVLPPPPP